MKGARNLHATPLPNLATETEKSWTQANEDAFSEAVQRRHEKRNGESESVWLVSYADIMTLLVGFFALLMGFSKVEEKKFEEIKQAVSEKFGGTYEKPHAALSESIKKMVTLQGLEQAVSVESDASGVTITFRDAIFFDVGSANVKAEANALMDRMILGIRPQTMDFDVVVEGHTDNIPMAGDQITNWELSGLRASRVVRSFVSNGFQPGRLQASGFGDTRPLVPNTTAEGVSLPENQAKNRRVVVKLIARAPAGETPQPKK